MTTGRILHLGLGAFHRAHQAVYLQHLRNLGDRDWTITATNLRSDGDAVLAMLERQGGRYTVETVSPAGEYRYETVDVIDTLLCRDARLTEVIGCGADPLTRILSFTVTEGGYCLAADGGLDWSMRDLVADRDRLATMRGLPWSTQLPASADGQSTLYAALAAVLRARHLAGSGPLTVLCCDNLRHNGSRVRALLLEFLHAVADRALRDWVAAEISFPDSMVDRITPRPSAEVVARVRAATGIADPAAVGAESWLQWVIEDRFVAGRPAFERVGVQLVNSVEPYEDAKLRVLNGSHSGLAWAGTLAGVVTIDAAIARPAIRGLVDAYVTDDVVPALTTGRTSPVDLPRYRDAVFARFGNTAIRDTVQRVAADGFAKLPVFLAPTVDDRLREGAPVDATAMLVALFLAFLQRWRMDALPYAYQDQAMDPVLARAICDAPDPVGQLCGQSSLWGARAGHPIFVEAVHRAWARLGDLQASGL